MPSRDILDAENYYVHLYWQLCYVPGTTSASVANAPQYCSIIVYRLLLTAYTIFDRLLLLLLSSTKTKQLRLPKGELNVMLAYIKIVNVYLFYRKIIVICKVDVCSRMLCVCVCPCLCVKVCLCLCVRVCDLCLYRLDVDSIKYLFSILC